MTERLDGQQDPYIDYRKNDSEWWMEMESSLKELFPDNQIPEDIKDHLVEFAVVRGMLRDGIEFPEDLTTFTKNYGNIHDPLFEDDLFIQAIKQITEAMGAQLEKNNRTDSWWR